MEKGTWLEIEELYKEPQQLGISQSVDCEKYYLYSLIIHSTATEGSALTEMDAQLLFDGGVTAKGGPLVYHLMNEGLKEAYELTKKETQRNTVIAPTFLRKLNATLARTAGGRHNTTDGSFGSSKGEFRLCGIMTGVDGRSYMDHQKVPVKIEELCLLLQKQQRNVETFREQYKLSFNVHLNLVTIHPWMDDNGRAARLLMNYIQFCYHLFLIKIFKEGRADYILSLQQAQDDEVNQPFLDFMVVQSKKSLSLEIQKYKASHDKGFSFMF